MLTTENKNISKKSTAKTVFSSDVKNQKALTKETQLFFKALQKN